MNTELNQNTVETQPQDVPTETNPKVETQPQQDNSTILLINNLNNRIDALNQKLVFLESNQTKLTTNPDEPLKGV